MEKRVRRWAKWKGISKEMLLYVYFLLSFEKETFTLAHFFEFNFRCKKIISRVEVSLAFRGVLALILIYNTHKVVVAKNLNFLCVIKIAHTTTYCDCSWVEGRQIVKSWSYGGNTEKEHEIFSRGLDKWMPSAPTPNICFVCVWKCDVVSGVEMRAYHLKT